MKYELCEREKEARTVSKYTSRERKKQGDKQTAVLARNEKKKQVSVYASCDSAATN